MTELITNGLHPDFIAMSNELDRYYCKTFGKVALQYQPHNQPETVASAILFYDGKIPVACGGIRPFDNMSVELKRIFVSPSYRRQGLARQIVTRLEELARQHGYRRVILETGAEMPNAIALYQTLGYHTIENFAPFQGDDICICMEKWLERP